MTETGVPQDQAPAVPTCYRHPGRETGVRCTRCDRYICPDCMTDAAVGFQCPECVREGRKSVRAARTVAGGKVTGDSSQVTRVLVGLCVGVFILAALTAGSADIFGSRVTPLHERFADLPIAVAAGEYYRLFTSMFLHFGAFHLLFNMYALFMVGPHVERALGRWRFLALYLLAGLGGNAASYAFGTINTYSAGASGAVFGLFGAYFVIQRRLRLDTSQMARLIAINVVISLVFSSFIDWRAHFGGLAVGALLAALFAYVAAPGGRRHAIHAAGTAAVLVVLLVAIAARTEQIRDQYSINRRPAQAAEANQP